MFFATLRAAAPSLLPAACRAYDRDGGGMKVVMSEEEEMVVLPFWRSEEVLFS
jgi:hypothetical protein